MTIVAHDAYVAQLEARIEELETLVAARTYERDAADRDRDIAFEAVDMLKGQLHQQAIQWEETRVELTRTQGRLADERQAKREAQAWKSSVLAICALPHEKFGPYDKLAWITAQEQKTYSAARHNGPQDTRLTSYGEWAKSVGCAKNTLSTSADRLATNGVIKREEVDCGDRHTHYTQEVNPDLWNNPRQAAPQEERPHNGGNKRCPQCGGYCKKKLTVRYECEKCGIEFDADMKPITSETISVTPLPVQQPVEGEKNFPDKKGPSALPPLPVQQPEPEPVAIPVFGSRPPLYCLQCKYDDKWTPTVGGMYRCGHCGYHQRGI